jgi:integrase
MGTSKARKANAMGRPINLLSPTRLHKLAIGMHSDGGGLYFARKSAHGASWVFRFARQGRTHDLGLGPFPAITLADARELATGLRRKLAHGVDILAERREIVPVKVSMTLGTAIAQYMESRSDLSAKTLTNWRLALAHAEPLYSLDVAKLSTADLMLVLKPLWTAKTDTASRMRQRLETVLDWAKVQGLREGDNPARWNGHIDQLLPRPSKVSPVQHHAALPWRDLPGVFSAIASDHAGQALRFCILTATRSVETIGAQWAEFDLPNRLWTIPAERTKMRKEHKVPLSDAALAILAALPRLMDSVFPALHADSLRLTLAKATKADCVVHGMRSTFADWAADSGWPTHVTELSLAHAVKGVEGVYRRTDLLERRTAQMQAWAAHCHALASGHLRSVA